MRTPYTEDRVTTSSRKTTLDHCASHGDDSRCERERKDQKKRFRLETCVLCEIHGNCFSPPGTFRRGGTTRNPFKSVSGFKALSAFRQLRACFSANIPPNNMRPSLVMAIGRLGSSFFYFSHHIQGSVERERAPPCNATGVALVRSKQGRVMDGVGVGKKQDVFIATKNKLTLPRSVSTTVCRLPQAICVTLAPSSRKCFTMHGVGCPLSSPCPSCQRHQAFRHHRRGEKVHRVHIEVVARRGRGTGSPCQQRRGWWVGKGWYVRMDRKAGTGATVVNCKQRLSTVTATGSMKHS